MPTTRSATSSPLTPPPTGPTHTFDLIRHRHCHPIPAGPKQGVHSRGRYLRSSSHGCARPTYRGYRPGTGCRQAQCVDLRYQACANLPNGIATRDNEATPADSPRRRRLLPELPEQPVGPTMKSLKRGFNSPIRCVAVTATDSCRPSVSVRPDRTLGGGVHRVVGETDLDRSVSEFGAACGERHRGIGVDLDGQGDIGSLARGHLGRGEHSHQQ